MYSLLFLLLLVFVYVQGTPLHHLFMHPMLGRFLLSRGSDVLAKVGDPPYYTVLCVMQ